MISRVCNYAVSAAKAALENAYVVAPLIGTPFLIYATAKAKLDQDNAETRYSVCRVIEGFGRLMSLFNETVSNTILANKEADPCIALQEQAQAAKFYVEILSASVVSASIISIAVTWVFRKANQRVEAN